MIAARPHSCPWSGHTPEVFLMSKSRADTRAIVISGQTAAKCSVWVHFPIVPRVRLCYHKRIMGHGGTWRQAAAEGHDMVLLHLVTVLMSMLCFMTRQWELAPVVWASDNRSHPSIKNKPLQWEQTPNLQRPGWNYLPLPAATTRQLAPNIGTIDPTLHHVHIRAGQDGVGMGVLSLALIW